MLPSSSSSSSSSTTWEHGVFLCFRGEDTREGFTSHLFQALVGSGINTFMDERLPKGRDISELLDRIQKSRVSVVIFSENFADSRWCLDELVEILECKERLGQEVLPVFYKVPPSQLRELRGKTAENLAKHGEKYGHDSDKVEKWRLTVKYFADLKGWHYTQGTESRLVSEIVETVRSISDLKFADQVSLQVDDPAGSTEPSKLDIAKHSKAAVIVLLVLIFTFFAFWLLRSLFLKAPSLTDVEKALDSIDPKVVGSIFTKEKEIMDSVIANWTHNTPPFSSSSGFSPFRDSWTSSQSQEEKDKLVDCQMVTPDNQRKPCDESLLRAIRRLPHHRFNAVAPPE